MPKYLYAPRIEFKQQQQQLLSPKNYLPGTGLFIAINSQVNKHTNKQKNVQFNRLKRTPTKIKPVFFFWKEKKRKNLIHKWCPGYTKSAYTNAGFKFNFGHKFESMIVFLVNVWFILFLFCFCVLTSLNLLLLLIDKI